MGGWLYGWMDEWTDGQVGRRAEGWKGEWTGGWTSTRVSALGKLLSSPVPYLSILRNPPNLEVAPTFFANPAQAPPTPSATWLLLMSTPDKGNLLRERRCLLGQAREFHAPGHSSCPEQLLKHQTRALIQQRRPQRQVPCLPTSRWKGWWW